jgi:hypothetical protein
MQMGVVVVHKNNSLMLQSEVHIIAVHHTILLLIFSQAFTNVASFLLSGCGKTGTGWI